MKELFESSYLNAMSEENDRLRKEIKRLKEEYVILQNASDEVEEEKDREIERQKEIIRQLDIKNLESTTIIKEVKQQLLNKKDIIEKSKYFKLVYYIDWNIKQEWDKRIVDKIDEIINIIDEGNK